MKFKNGSRNTYDISNVVKWSSAFKKHKNALGSCNKYNSFDQHDQSLIHLNIPLVPVVQCPAYFLQFLLNTPLTFLLTFSRYLYTYSYGLLNCQFWFNGLSLNMCCRVQGSLCSAFSTVSVAVVSTYLLLSCLCVQQIDIIVSNYFV